MKFNEAITVLRSTFVDALYTDDTCTEFTPEAEQMLLNLLEESE